MGSPRFCHLPVLCRLNYVPARENTTRALLRTVWKAQHIVHRLADGIVDHDANRDQPNDVPKRVQPVEKRSAASHLEFSLETVPRLFEITGGGLGVDCLRLEPFRAQEPLDRGGMRTRVSAAVQRFGVG